MYRRFSALAALIVTPASYANASKPSDNNRLSCGAGRDRRRKTRGAIATMLCALWALPTAAALMMVTSSSVRAAEITFVEALKDATGGVTNMQYASDVAASPDGRHVYVAAVMSSSIAIFSRNLSTGRLTYVGSITSSVGGPTLTAAFAVEVSPDGKHVYAGSPTGNAVVAFSRNADTGVLTLVENYSGITLGLQSKGFVSLSVSPDGKSVYGITGEGVNGVGDGLVVFSRNSADGKLTLVEEHVDNVNGNLLGQEFSQTTSPINNIAVSSDNAFVYVTSTTDNAVSVFARNQSTGALTLASSVVDGAGGADGIQRASSLILSPDNKFLYVSGQGENSVAIFSRNAVTGALTYVAKKTQGVDGITTLDGARSLAVSPDGRYVYVSAITSNSITVFNRNAVTGDLSLAIVATQGVGGVDGIQGVSGMVTDPLSRNLYAAGQSSNSIAVFSLPVPAVVLSTTARTVDENGLSTALDAGLQVFDADDPTLPSASVTVASGLVDSDMLSVTPQGNISASYNSSTGILTLTGTDTLAAYQAVLRTVRFQAGNDSSLDAGQTSTKTIAFRVFDGNNESAAAIVTITVNGSSGPPSYTLDYVAGSDGSISGSASQTVIAGGSGTAVTAVPATGYHFVQWSDASTANPRTDTDVNAHLSVSSSFAINMYAVTSGATGNGSIGPASIDVAHGGTTTFSVVPASGATLLQVQGCGGTLSGNTFTTGPITSACAVTAAFSQPNVAVTVEAKSRGGGGSFDLWMSLAAGILAFARRFRRGAGWVALAAMTTASANASAEQAGHWYSGAQIGQARSDVTARQLAQRLQQPGYDVTVRLSDTTRSAWRVHAGYQWTANLGIEAGYVDLGEVSATFRGVIADVDSFLSVANRSHPASADGFDLSLVARYEFGSRYEVSARAGALRWDNRIGARNSDGAAVRSGDDGIDALFGIGAGVSLGHHWSVTAEGIRYGVRGDHVDFLGAGLVYRWR